jgi:zinc protease
VRKVLPMMLLAMACASTTPAPDAERPSTPSAEATPAPEASAVPPIPHMPGQPKVVTLDSKSPLVTIRVMLKHGSTSDPKGKEGLAALTGEMITDGGYRNGDAVVTKEQLAELTMPWGSGARPTVFTSARATTFFFTAPREVIPQYVRDVLRPMLTRPEFENEEVERLKNEALSSITSLRSEDLEGLGLTIIDQYVLAGTGYAHPTVGTESAIASLTRADVQRFYRDFYRPENTIIGISTSDAAVVEAVREAVYLMNRDANSPSREVPMPKPAAFTGRHALVVEEPNAPAASVHFGFPIEVNRSHPDYWPLYVANVWLGTHRDSTGVLYGKIREERGYNYGDYSYIEYWGGRSQSLFQIFNQPREQQYFSIWVRPVKHEHAVHLMKATTYEVEQMVRNGLTADDVAAAKNKARVLYLNLGETVPRLIGARVDDAFYGASGGFLDSYLQQLDRVTVEQVNAAVRRHINTANIKYVVVTSTPHVQKTIAEIRSTEPVFGKTWQEYEFTQAKLADGTTVWQVPEAKMPTVQLDAVWAAYPLNVQDVQTRHVKDMFK